jgi:iron only hydrogenase large subunit-like protein
MKSPAQPDLLLVLGKERCQGCTHCLRACPTEAIRIRHGKAEVMPHRCVQCGRCIQVCPRGAWGVRSDSLEKVKKDGEAVAVLDPTVFWQFGGQVSPQEVARAFLKIGFSAVQDLGEGLEIYGAAVSSYLSSEGRMMPAIASACPAVVQFVEVKYPSLTENLVPIVPPLRILANRWRDSGRRCGKQRLFYIVPCLAQAGAAIQDLRKGEKSNGAIPFANVFNPLKAIFSQKGRSSGAPFGKEPLPSGMRWASPGGESEALENPASLVVDGMANVANILELAESGLLNDVPFIEAWACAGGCLGGPLTVQNPFLARHHLMAWSRHNKCGIRKAQVPVDMEPFRRSHPFASRPGMRLDEDLKVAMEKLRRIDEVVMKFPGIDCGSCGCPNCLALAEDIIQGHATEDQCFYVLKGKAARSSRPRGRRTENLN